MDLFKTFLDNYGAEILYTIVTAIAGYIGIVLKGVYVKHVNNEIKKDVANTCVKAVEQIYKDLHGEEKLNKALASASEMLTEKGVNVSDAELRLLIESAVAEFNNAFNKKLKPLNESNSAT